MPTVSCHSIERRMASDTCAGVMCASSASRRRPASTRNASFFHRDADKLSHMCAATKILAGQRPLLEELPYVLAGIAGAGSS